MLVYSTVLGGHRYDAGRAVAVDVDRNVYITGTTGSRDFPATPDSFAPSAPRAGDAFLAKLDRFGWLVYCTYLGGSGVDHGLGIAVDGQGCAYVTGATNSPDFPTTAGSHQPRHQGTFDGFVAKVDPAGARLLYATYLGGTGADRGLGISVDDYGNAYVVGDTTSADFPTTAQAFQRSSGGGFDAFVAKLDPTGSRLAYATYVGGSGIDEGLGIAVERSGCAYIAGATSSRNFPRATRSVTTNRGAAFDAFAAKLNDDGSALDYCALLTGRGSQAARGIALDNGGRAHVVPR
jgi:hypothetical protein